MQRGPLFASADESFFSIDAPLYLQKRPILVQKSAKHKMKERNHPTSLCCEMHICSYICMKANKEIYLKFIKSVRKAMTRKS